MDLSGYWYCLQKYIPEFLLFKLLYLKGVYFGKKLLFRSFSDFKKLVNPRIQQLLYKVESKNSATTVPLDVKNIQLKAASFEIYCIIPSFCRQSGFFHVIWLNCERRHFVLRLVSFVLQHKNIKYNGVTLNFVSICVK